MTSNETEKSFWEGVSGWSDEASANAFGALGNPDRIAILRALWEQSNQWLLSVDPPMGFVELQQAAGFEDKGRFNYHLKQLLGTFIRQDERGYGLTYAGKSIVRLIRSGNLEETPSYGPTRVEGRECRRCGEQVALLYKDEHLHVLCNNCAQESDDLGTGIPSGVIAAHASSPSVFQGRSVTEIYELVGKQVTTTMDAFASGFCPECAGTASAVFDLTASNPGKRMGTGYLAMGSCDVCSFSYPVTLWHVALRHPHCIAFYDALDINVATPSWELYDRLDDVDERVESTNPPRVRIEFEYDGEMCAFSVDESLTAKSVESSLSSELV